MIISCLFHSIRSGLFEIERVATLSKSKSDLVTISSSEPLIEGKGLEADWEDFQNQGWQGSGAALILALQSSALHRLAFRGPSSPT